MDVIRIEATKKTPEVVFDEAEMKFSMTGRCIPSNAATFFEPLIALINSINVQENSKLTCEFKLEYINSSSSKWLIGVVKDLNEKHKTGSTVILNWYYEDDDSFDFGEVVEEVAEFEVIRIESDDFDEDFDAADYLV